MEKNVLVLGNLSTKLGTCFVFLIFDALKWLFFQMELSILDHCTLWVATQIGLLQGACDSHSLQLFGLLLQGQFFPSCST